MDVSPGSKPSPLSPSDLEAITRALTDSGQFGEPIGPHVRGLQAPATRESAFYRLLDHPDGRFVSLVTSDRWLSQSIEQQLVISGDKLEDLLEEELIDLDSPITRLKVDHFRDDDKLFTFRSPVPPGSSVAAIGLILRGYEACFRRLGDMEGGDEG